MRAAAVAAAAILLGLCTGLQAADAAGSGWQSSVGFEILSVVPRTKGAECVASFGTRYLVVARSGTVAEDRGVEILDTQDPAAVDAVQHVRLRNPRSGELCGARWIVVRGVYAYVATGACGGLHVVHLSAALAALGQKEEDGTPVVPAAYGFVATSGAAAGLAVSRDGGTVYVADGPGGIVAVDVTVPKLPLARKTLPFSEGVWKLRVEEAATDAGGQGGQGADTLLATYGSHGSGGVLRVLPEDGRVLWRFTTGSPTGVDARGGTVYVSNADHGLVTLDAPPNAAAVGSGTAVPPPTKTASELPQGTWGETTSVAAAVFALTEPFPVLLAAQKTTGVQVLTLGNPQEPYLFATVPLPHGNVRQVSVLGTHIYVADLLHGVSVVRVRWNNEPYTPGPVTPPPDVNDSSNSLPDAGFVFDDDDENALQRSLMIGVPAGLFALCMLVMLANCSYNLYAKKRDRDSVNFGAALKQGSAGEGKGQSRKTRNTSTFGDLGKSPTDPMLCEMLVRTEDWVDTVPLPAPALPLKEAA